MATAPASQPLPVPTARRRDRRGVIAAAISLIVLLGFATLVQTQANGYQQQIVVLVFIYSMVAVALAVTSGFTGVFSLGQIGFLAIGAYVSAVIDIPPMWKDEITLADLPPWLAKLDMTVYPAQVSLFIACMAAGLVAALVGLLVGAPLMRLSGHYVAVATMGFLIIVYTLVVNADGYTAGSRGLSQIPGWTNAWVAAAWCAFTIYAAWRLRNSAQGRAMIASRENLLAARGVGVNVLRTRLLAFVWGAFVTGVAGALLGHQVGTIAPSQFYFQTTFVVITMVVLGGMGSISGAVVGAVIMTILPEYLRDVDTGLTIGSFTTPALYGLSQIILAVGFILVMIFKPTGLLGDRELGIGLLSKRSPNDDAFGDSELLTPSSAPGLDSVPLDSRE